jgi:inhibitor of cysteine peptidase
MRRAAALLVALLGAGLLASAAGAGTIVTVGAAANGKTVRLEVGATLVVRLAGNPTTGYTWSTKTVDRRVLRPLPIGYTASRNLPGSGGVFRIRFRAIARGTTTLRLVYARPFEHTAPPRRFSLRVVVG